MMDGNEMQLATGIYGPLPGQFLIGEKQAYALKDNEMSGIVFWCMSGRGKNAVDKKSASFAEQIPEHAVRAKAQYERVRVHKFFDRLMLFTRNTERDGVIIAVGIDEFWYTLATWDADTEHVWIPEFDESNPDWPKLTRACLGH